MKFDSKNRGESLRGRRFGVKAHHEHSIAIHREIKHSSSRREVVKCISAYRRSIRRAGYRLYVETKVGIKWHEIMAKKRASKLLVNNAKLFAIQLTSVGILMVIYRDTL